MKILNETKNKPKLEIKLTGRAGCSQDLRSCGASTRILETHICNIEQMNETLLAFHLPQYRSLACMSKVVERDESQKQIDSRPIQ